MRRLEDLIYAADRGSGQTVGDRQTGTPRIHGFTTQESWHFLSHCNSSEVESQWALRHTQVQQEAAAEIAEDGDGAKGRGMAEGREEREGGKVGEGRKEKEVTLAYSREDLSEVGEQGRGGGGEEGADGGVASGNRKRETDEGFRAEREECECEGVRAERDMLLREFEVYKTLNA